jgi:hypothetical protein
LIDLEMTMFRLRTLILLAAMVCCLDAGLASAQTPATPPAAASPAASQPSTASGAIDDVSKWTRREWNRAKAKWAQERTKWSACRAQAKAKNLVGRHSWQFLYDCMTKS